MIVRSVSDISRILINSKKEISNSLILDKININMELPKEFIEYTSSLFGEEKWKNYLASFDGSVPVSVRLNPFKAPQSPEGAVPVPWCRNAFYLAERPNFTLDPLLSPPRGLFQSLGAVTLSILPRDRTSRLIHYSMPEYITFRKQEVCFLTKFCDN